MDRPEGRKSLKRGQRMASKKGVHGWLRPRTQIAVNEWRKLGPLSSKDYGLGHCHRFPPLLRLEIEMHPTLFLAFASAPFPSMPMCHPLPARRVNMEMEAAKRQPAGTTTCDGTGQRMQCKGRGWVLLLVGQSKDRRDYCLAGLATPSLIVCHRTGRGSHPTMPKFDYGPAAESAGGRKD